MFPHVFKDPRVRNILLAAILGLAVLTRLYHFGGPLTDQMAVKQVYTSNHARNIAQPSWDPMRTSLDFLDEGGGPMRITEEFPLYIGLLGASYRAFGEHEWLGRVLSILATLLAVWGLFDLMRREYDEPTGLAAAFLFSMTPLLIFYGRAVLPDPAMLACMVLSAAFYRRHLDGGHSPGWLAASAAAGLTAVAFKNFGVLVLIPLADMAYRQDGRRAWLSPRFLALVGAMTLPLAVWTVAVFARVPNPTTRTSYFLWQMPHVLVEYRIYERLTSGVLVQDCGPLTAVLIVWGLVGALRGRAEARSRPLWGWSVMGLLFFFVCAPKLQDHVYYELMMLPALAGWGALGVRCLGRFRPGSPALARGFAVALTALIALTQSPLLMDAKYQREMGFTILGRRLNRVCSPSGRFVVLGQRIGWAVVHYSGRKGWVDQCLELRADWQEAFDRCRTQGAEYVAVYFDPTTPQEVRATYAPLIGSMPLVEHDSGPWFPGRKPCEYYILSLKDWRPGVARAGLDRPANRNR